MGVKSLNKYLNEYEAADEESKDMAKRLIQLEEKLKTVPVAGTVLADVPLMIAMIKAWIKKEYTVVSTKVIISLVGAALYIVNRNDLIPDSWPLIGMIDDLAVLGLALKISEPELKAFSAWRDAQKNQPEAAEASPATEAQK